MIKIWADFNATSDFGLRLNCKGTLEDLERRNIVLQEGMSVLLWDEDYDDSNRRDDLIVEAIIRFNQNTEVWEGEFNWDDIKHESEYKR